MASAGFGPGAGSRENLTSQLFPLFPTQTAGPEPSIEERDGRGGRIGEEKTRERERGGEGKVKNREGERRREEEEQSGSSRNATRRE